MSQASKILHLYVEVRSVAEDEDNVSEGRDDGRSSRSLLQCPDVLPISQRSSNRSSPNRSPDLSPASVHRARIGSQSLPSSKSSSRHSVSFQLQNPDATGSPTQVHRQDMLYDSFGDLLQALVPELTNPGQHSPVSLGRKNSSDRNLYQGRAPMSPSSTSTTLPSTPTSSRRSYDPRETMDEHGRTSVVTYGYIEKADVHSMGGRRAPVCQSEPVNPSNRMDFQKQQHLQKRFSDPVWSNNQQPRQCDPYRTPHHYPSPNQSPYKQRPTTLDPIGREATYRALEEFGSPDLRRKFSGYNSPECGSPTLPRHYHYTGCRSWAGSPVLPRSTVTLPNKANPNFHESDRGVYRSLVNGIPRSPASDRLSAHTGYSPSTSSYRSHALPQSPQRPWTGQESPTLSHGPTHSPNRPYVGEESPKLSQGLSHSQQRPYVGEESPKLSQGLSHSQQRPYVGEESPKLSQGLSHSHQRHYTSDESSKLSHVPTQSHQRRFRSDESPTLSHCRSQSPQRPWTGQESPNLSHGPPQNHQRPLVGEESPKLSQGASHSQQRHYTSDESPKLSHCRSQSPQRPWTGQESPKLSHGPPQNHQKHYTSVESPKLSHCRSQSPQRPLTGDVGPRLSSKFHPPLPAGRPTDIQHEIPVSEPLTSNHSMTSGTPQHSVNSSCSSYSANPPNTSHNAKDSTHYTAIENANLSSKIYHNSSRSSSIISDTASPTNSRKSIIYSSPNAKIAGKLAVEATKLSSIFADRRTPSPTPSQAESFRSESPRAAGGLLLKECQPYATLHGQISPDFLHDGWKTDKAIPHTRPGLSLSLPASPALPAKLHRAAITSQSPILDPRHRQSLSPNKETPSYKSTLHRYAPPQYAGDRKAPAMELKQYDHLFDRSPRDSPELSKRLLTTETLPASWTSRHRDWADRDEFCEEKNNLRSTSPVKSLSEEECQRIFGGEKSVDVSVGQSYERPVTGVNKDQKEEGVAGMSSQSSSGVTGSLVDSSQTDRIDSLSPETSSQSSHDTADTGSGMQSDGGSATPSARQQKIAQAKWDFLFGVSTEERRCTKEARSKSPSPTPPSSLRLKPANQSKGRDKAPQASNQHQVRQVEVELVTCESGGSRQKTGIIRRTVRYSETDLDAVPLRCYRETDLDEVMRAEAEAADEAEEDKAFGNRNVLGNLSFSPAETSLLKHTEGSSSSLKPRTGGQEEEGESEGEEEGGVVSWASVRMLGDKQRQKATNEEEEVFSLLLKGPLEACPNSHGGLKSPISLAVPRRPSEQNLDSFSRHFECIMESHRAKGTSYSSLDSVDLLTSGSTSVFTFDLPTLTPEIQSQICDSAKQIMELSFAPLAQCDGSDLSRSECTFPGVERGLRGGAENHTAPVRSRSAKESLKRSSVKEGFRKASSVPSLHTIPKERPGLAAPPIELLCPQPDVAERLARGVSDDMLLTANGTRADRQAARRLALRLFALEGFKKSDVARHLGKNNDFSQMVAEEYLSNFNFTALTIDQSLRMFLRQFALMGETQERERVLSQFSRRYRQCNPQSDTNEDSVHTLTCAIMLLNTDLHGNNIGKRMSCSQFITNLEGLNNGKDFPKDLLKSLYSSIKNEKLQWTIDEEELRKSMSELDSASQPVRRPVIGGNPLVGVANRADAELYKNGFLVRKVHADPDGKRTARGKRGWKSFYAMLKGLVLYLQKDEFRAEKDLTDEDVRNAVSIHHALALRAADYRKRPNVFYLRTADWRVFLFQAPNAEQMQSWITRINVVAAMFSAPPFPAAIGSQKRFSRPLLPGSNTKLTQEEQAKCHESRFRAVSSELSDITATSPDRKVKGRELEEMKLRQEYLEFEKTRYGTYAMLLRAKLSGGDQSLAAFESRLFDDGGLQRAHSSPTLPLDGAAGSHKDKHRGSKTSKSLKGTSTGTSSSSAATNATNATNANTGSSSSSSKKKNGGSTNQHAETS